MFGESSARGMELVTRSEARGRVLLSLGLGMGVVGVDAEGGGEGGGSGRASWAAASSHAARAEGSMGHADGGGLLGGSWTLLEEVFPMVMGWNTIESQW